MIHEKKIKKTTLEQQMAKLKGTSLPGEGGKKTGPNFSLFAIFDGSGGGASLPKSQSTEKLPNEKRVGFIEEPKKPSD
jgi:hypothetical protein